MKNNGERKEHGGGAPSHFLIRQNRWKDGLKIRAPFGLAFVCGALFFAVGALAEEKGVPLRPGPDEGGTLPESVRNEVEVAIDRGVKWLVEQQNEDGSFGETNCLFYTIGVRGLLEAKGMTESAIRAAKWISKQQADDGGFAETNRVHYSLMIDWAFWFVVEVEEAKARVNKWLDGLTDEEKAKTKEQLLGLNPLGCIDKSLVDWRIKLAAQRVATQVVKGSVGYWQAKDVEVSVKSENWELWKAFWGVAEVGPRHEDGNGKLKNARLPSDLAATLFVVLQLMDL